MTKSIIQGLACVAALAIPALAAGPTRYHEKFDGDKRPKNWGVNFGHWEPEKGHLVVRQLEKDNHAAASRWRIPMSDGTIKAKVDLGKSKGFHIGFDPKPGTLKKKGHLFSLVITPTKAMLKKHKDKADPKSREEVLTTAGYDQLEDWIDVELTTVGDKVSVRIGSGIKMEATDPTFHVAKPTVVFRVIGGDVLIDEIEVVVLKP